MIAASGDILARGKPGWRVGFQQTERVLEDRAVSTSGNTYQPGHILDPRSGQRVMSSETVSVVARDSMTADALATTCLMLKGAERAALLAAYAGTRSGMIHGAFVKAIQSLLTRRKRTNPRQDLGITPAQ